MELVEDVQAATDGAGPHAAIITSSDVGLFGIGIFPGC